MEDLHAKANMLRVLQINEDGRKELTPYEALDEIITTFCTVHGGLEEAMPMVRKKFAEADVDFSNPTKEGLKKVADKLVEVTRFLKGPDIAERERKKFRWILRRVPEESR